MTAFVSRPFAGAADLDRLIRFARRICTERGIESSYWQPGDITWQFYRSQEGDPNLQLWLDQAGVAGFGAFEPPVVVAFDVRTDIGLDSDLAHEILDWAEGRRAEVARPGTEDVPVAYEGLGQGVSTLVVDSDAARQAFLEKRGYRRHDQGGLRFVRSLAEPVEVNVPEGMRLRWPTDNDIAARAELHRAAWNVWGPSRFSEEAYRELRAAPLYEPELDVVLETAEGQMVSYCVCWADAELGAGHFEPVGTRAEFAGRGLGRVVIAEGLRRLRARGLRHAYVGTASVNAPAQRLYAAAGFEPYSAEHYYTRPIVAPQAGAIA